MCTGNEIKSAPGDATDCSADPPCNAETEIPNHDHSGCGKLHKKSKIDRKNSTEVSLHKHFLTIPVCALGHFINGSRCLPCLRHVSGSGGEKLIDGNTSSCMVVPQKTYGPNLLHVLSLHGNCTTESDVTLDVTMETTATCNDLRSVLVMAKPGSECNIFGDHFNVCDVLNTNQLGGKNVCSLECKCADSAEQCLIHVYSGLDITTPDLSICEITSGSIDNKSLKNSPYIIIDVLQVFFSMKINPIALINVYTYCHFNRPAIVLLQSATSMFHAIS